MSSPFSRTLPARPDYDQQRTQAKELLRSFTAGEAEALARIRAVLPDKKRITLADAQLVLAREYGFDGWAKLSAHIDALRGTQGATPEQQMHDAFQRHDANAVRRLFERYPELRRRIDEPVFSFNSPAIVAYADDDAIVEVLLELGANPNRKSDWWAGGFHALYEARGRTADKLIAAGAIVDACAAAHLDRMDLLSRIIAEDPSRVHERGGDGKTPLHFAESRTVVDFLLANGADIDARDIDHRSTAAEWMLDRRRELARYVVDRGASTDIFLAAALGLTDRVRTMLEADHTLLNLRVGRGDYGEKPPSSYHIYFWTIGDSLSPLDVATRFEHAATVAAMLPFASPVQRLLLACRSGDETTAHTLVREHPGLVASMSPEQHRALADAAWAGDGRAVRLMLDLGFDPRVSGHDSGTCLHLGAWEGSVEVVSALLRHPDAAALVSIKDAHYGATPLGWCCHGSLHGNRSHDHVGVARLLLAAGAKPGPDCMQASPSVLAVIGR